MLKTNPVNPFGSSHYEFPAYGLSLVKLDGLDAIFNLHQQTAAKDTVEVDIIGRPEDVASMDIKVEGEVLRIVAKAESEAPAEAGVEDEARGRWKGAMNAVKGISAKLNAAMETNPLRVIVYLPSGVEAEAENLSGRISVNGISKLKAETKDSLDIDTVYSLDLTVSGELTILAMAGVLTLTVNKGGNVYVHSGTILEANITARNGGKVVVNTVVEKAYLRAFEQGAIYIAAVREIKSRHADKDAIIVLGSD